MHRLGRNSGFRGSKSKRRIGASEKHSPKRLSSVIDLDRMLVEFSMCLFSLPLRDKSIVRKHLRLLHCGLRPGGSVSGALPRYFLPKNAA